MIKSILKGMVIGIANIIPGVSGGTMMVSMGIYDKAIHCITHLFSEFKKSILFLLPIFIGMGIAIVGSSFGLEYLFAQFPVQTSPFIHRSGVGRTSHHHQKCEKRKRSRKENQCRTYYHWFAVLRSGSRNGITWRKGRCCSEYVLYSDQCIEAVRCRHSCFRYYGSTRRQRLHDASFDGILQSDPGDYHRLFQKSGGL